MTEFKKEIHLLDHCFGISRPHYASPLIHARKKIRIDILDEKGDFLLKVKAP